MKEEKRRKTGEKMRMARIRHVLHARTMLRVNKQSNKHTIGTSTGSISKNRDDNNDGWDYNGDAKDDDADLQQAEQADGPPMPPSDLWAVGTTRACACHCDVHAAQPRAGSPTRDVRARAGCPRAHCCAAQPPPRRTHRRRAVPRGWRGF